MLIKTIINQGQKIIELDKGITALKNENKDLRFENEELQEYKKKTEKLQDRIIMDLLSLQDVSRLGIAEAEKDKHRNVIINNIIKELDVGKTY